MYVLFGCFSSTFFFLQNNIRVFVRSLLYVSFLRLLLRFVQSRNYVSLSHSLSLSLLSLALIHVFMFRFFSQNVSKTAAVADIVVVLVVIININIIVIITVVGGHATVMLPHKPPYNSKILRLSSLPPFYLPLASFGLNSLELSRSHFIIFFLASNYYHH